MVCTASNWRWEKWRTIKIFFRFCKKKIECFQIIPALARIASAILGDPAMARVQLHRFGVDHSTQISDSQRGIQFPRKSSVEGWLSPRRLAEAIAESRGQITKTSNDHLFRGIIIATP